ncbi:hypothetical protein pb186bvf_008616 [Paramecium bursaria]
MINQQNNFQLNINDASKSIIGFMIPQSVNILYKFKFECDQDVDLAIFLRHSLTQAAKTSLKFKRPPIGHLNWASSDHHIVEIKIKGNSKILPFKANHYYSLQINSRLQHPLAVFVQRLSPYSIVNVNSSYLNQIKDSIASLDKEIQKLLPNQHKYFTKLIIEEIYINHGLEGLFILENLAKVIEPQAKDQIQQLYLQRCAKNIPLQYQYQIKIQLKRLQQYFCSQCNLYACSLHFNAKSQRLYIEKEPEVHDYDPVQQNPLYDKFYDCQFKANQQVFRQRVENYQQGAQKLEMQVQCSDIEQCSRGHSNKYKPKLKKYQIKTIEHLQEYGFKNPCYIALILSIKDHIPCSSIKPFIKQAIPRPIQVKKQKKIIQKDFSQKIYAQCIHDEDCDSGECYCVTCFKWCCCAGKCKQSFKPCNCGDSCGFRQEKQKIVCPCYEKGFECDPELCRCKNCKNQNCSQKIRTKLMLGQSNICHGIGVFAAQKFKNSDYIGEYVGNLLINEDESLCVEQIDQLTATHYIFDVDEYWSIDGTYFGNKTRFINHCSINSGIVNCRPAVMFVKGSWKVLFFATKSIEIGQELFFDYGEKFQTDWKKYFDAIVDKYYKKNQ